MTDARHKVKEAEYFFEKMKKNIEDDKVFSFNLSAFLTSARSVTFLMQKEYQHVLGFQDWYADKRKLMQSDNDFEFFNDLRVATVHTKAIMPNKKVTESIIEPAISITDSVSVRVIRVGKVAEEYPTQGESNDTKPVLSSFKDAVEPFRLLGKKFARNKGSRNISRFFKERPSEDLVGMCEKYLGNLRKLVDDGEQLFDRT
jgi:hypothetical protein